MKVAGGREGKEQCRALALQRFPACAASFARVEDAGRAEAALLALYAAQRLGPFAEPFQSYTEIPVSLIDARKKLRIKLEVVRGFWRATGSIPPNRFRSRRW